MASFKFIQENAIGCCPESLLSGIMQHHFAIPVLKRSMGMQECEWTPFSAALSWGTTILLLSNFQMCPWGTIRAGLHVWLWSQTRLVLTFLLHGPADGFSMLDLESDFPPFCWCLIITIRSDKCFSFWVTVALTLGLRKRNLLDSHYDCFFFNQGFWLKGLLVQAPRYLFLEDPEFTVNAGKWSQRN